MKPFFIDEQAGIKIYCCDARELLPELAGEDIDLVLTDPPYGIRAARSTRGNTQYGRALAISKDYGCEGWDDSCPSPELVHTVIASAKYAIVWGGNYFEPLPASSCWLVWDKDNGSNGYADCELAWTNLDKAVRLFRWKWHGMLQEQMGSRKELREHPTQKPVALMKWCLSLVPDAQTILDPFMGSGTTLLAAKQLGRRAIGIEISEEYCQIAIKRLKQEILPFGVNEIKERQSCSQLPMFSGMATSTDSK